MSSIPDLQLLENPQDPFELAEEPEDEALLRLTGMVEHLFQVPAAYLALLGPEAKVVTRIGSGDQYWGFLKTFPLPEMLAGPQVWRDLSLTPAYGAVHGDLRFVATAVMRSRDGLDLGLLVIADVQPRPNFSRKDHDSLSELASTAAAKMEVRMIVSRARESEMLLREAERRFRNMANCAPVMIAYSGADAAASFINQTWLDFTGRTLDEELGDGFAEMFHPDYRASVMQSYWDAFREHKPLLIEFPMLRRDGEYRWILAQGMPRFQPAGVFTGYIGCLVDISDQRSAVRALEKQTLCTDAVAEASGVFYLVLDPEGRIEQTSPKCPPVCGGRDLRRSRGDFLWDVCGLAAPESRSMRHALRQTVAGRATAEFRTSSRARAGAEWLWRFTPVLAAQGELLAITATVSGPGAIPA